MGRGCFQKAIPGLLNRSKNIILEAAGVFFKGCKEEEQRKKYITVGVTKFFLKKIFSSCCANYDDDASKLLLC